VRKVRKMASVRFVPMLMVTTESQQAKRMEAKTRAPRDDWSSPSTPMLSFR
jgi:hypothetical protein